MITPTQRALAYCRARGWPAWIVERWNPHARIRQDLFGMFDLLVMVIEPERTTGHLLGVQCGAGSMHAAKVAHLRANDTLHLWHRCGASAAVWTFAKRGARGKRKLWTMRATYLGVRGLPDDEHLPTAAAGQPPEVDAGLEPG